MKGWDSLQSADWTADGKVLLAGVTPEGLGPAASRYARQCSRALAAQGQYGDGAAGLRIALGRPSLTVAIWRSMIRSWSANMWMMENF